MSDRCIFCLKFSFSPMKKFYLYTSVWYNCVLFIDLVLFFFKFFIQYYIVKYWLKKYQAMLIYESQKYETIGLSTFPLSKIMCILHEILVL